MLLCRISPDFVARICKYFQWPGIGEKIWARQWCDKGRRFVDEIDDHPGIPRDADGVPIFFILPPAKRASYDKKLARCEVRWRATGDPAFAIEAYVLTYLHRQPPALWVTEAVCNLGTKSRTKGYVTRAFNAGIRRMRYEAVRDAHGGGPKRGGLTWTAAYDRAAENLAQTPAAAGRDSMEADYKKVKRDLKQGRFDRFGVPKMPRKKLGDVLRRKPSPR